MTRYFFIALTFFFAFLIEAAVAKPVLDVQDITTPKGINIWLVEDHSVPVISMGFSFPGGLAFDPDDKLGTARLVSILLDEGAGDMNSQAFQKKLSEHAIQMRFTPGRDDFIGSLRTLSENKALAFDLLRLALHAPRFDQDAIARMKNTATEEIKDNLGDPSWLVARTFNGMIFEGHYYARPGSGTPDGIAKITRQDLVDYARRQFNRGVRVALSGNITKAEAVKLVDAVFGDLPEAPDTAPADFISLQNKGKTILLPLGTPQTHVMVAQEGVKQNDPDWFSAYILDHILGGGGFDSRLMKGLRKERGLTYGVYTQLASLKQAHTLQASFSSSNDKIKEALSLLRAEWKKMARNGVTQKELDDAKSYLTGSLLLHLTSTADIAETLNALQRDGLPADYINTRNDKIDAVSLSDVKRVAKSLLKPDDLSVILVGDPKDVAIDLMLDGPPGIPKQPEE
jgi:zinc protease